MENAFIAAVTLSALVTVAVRAMPIVLLSQVRLPSLIYNWLGFIPAAIMAAIIASELMVKPSLTTSGWSVSALAAGAAFSVGIVSRSLFFTVLAGILAFIALQALVP
ncbi:AzlD domain-containing protein [Brucella tritici]|uniref:AzlD domain-containing protein n=1 Tax=Brucella tritici TaxID=94626 RepID=A0A6L3Y6P7_9HYPH|nr:AzlD domain-containing protein [Brucella tritici]KAB2676070.1 AzlD domain-containing protein [Brucella tritici]